MSQRILKVNKHLQRTIGEILLVELDLPQDVLVTVSDVDTAPNLKSADVWLYISPIEKAEEVLEFLKPQMYEIQGSLNRKLEFRPLPRIKLRIDRGAEHAANVEQHFPNS